MYEISKNKYIYYHPYNYDMTDKNNEIEEDLILTEKELEILVDKKVSDYVQVIIDEDEDVRIIDNFMGVTESILPKDEAIAVSRFILEFFKIIPETEIKD
ncbi:MAG: hypothetical protein HeimC2_20000 [Candidatus Heimdallarchaeota archaeon LC_2]|nr:MAG: hypothetical protein HeimC2_20000 [Candidatus Heimdallarchaeota archaeon LC_2]